MEVPTPAAAPEVGKMEAMISALSLVVVLPPVLQAERESTRRSAVKKTGRRIGRKRDNNLTKLLYSRSPVDRNRPKLA
jgi:hypothetical protein